LRATGAIKVTSVHPAGIATPIAHSARAGRGVTAAARQEAEEYFRKVALITPEEASRVIIKGIRGNKKRVLIGSDAYRIDRMQRLFPARASSMFASFLEKRRGQKDSQAASSASKTV
ncbi:MAG: SDR family NAD(P)-dependent oxidoreductase, partial [Candidatus Angelobacter sp.]